MNWDWWTTHGWIDKDTFFCEFGDYKKDSEGDEYWYNCEYHADENRFVFLKMYEYDYVDADFSEAEKLYIMVEIIDKMTDCLAKHN